MIILIHGDNVAASRKHFLDLKAKAKNSQILDGSKITIADLAQIIEGRDLFEDSQAIFIENFFAKRKPSRETDAIGSYITTHGKNHEIFLWESKTLTPKQVSALKGARLEKFDFPKVLFSFLDAIFPKNSVKAIEFFHRTVQNEAPEFVFFMLVRHFRILLTLLHSGDEQSENSRISQGADSGHARMTKNQIDEVKRLAPWQKTKLEKQAQLFSEQQLIDIYNKLFIIEEGLKTGRLSSSLTQAIDFLLLSI